MAAGTVVTAASYPAAPGRQGADPRYDAFFPENAASLRLHDRAGFRVVGVDRRHGKLDGAWRDCVIVERRLGEAAAP